MKKDKEFDAVRMTREIRDKLSSDKRFAGNESKTQDRDEKVEDISI